MTGGTTGAIVTIAEAQAFARVETGEEEALIAGFIRAASELCESFINQVVIARDFTVDVPASGEWERLPVTPVQAITSVQAVAADNLPAAMAAEAFAVDVDSSGDGWVRTPQACGIGRLWVTGTAGLATSANGVPEPIRQGVLRLVSHLLSVRDGPGGEPPAAVTALWRPYRRLRLSR